MAQEITLARKRLKTPRAAAIAGIVFSLLLMASLVIIRLSLPADPKDPGGWIANPVLAYRILIALNMIPFSGIAFLWFIGVIRDLIGEREDKFFATVFLGSGLLFVAMLFAAAAVAGGLLANLSSGTDGQSITATNTFAFGRGMMNPNDAARNDSPAVPAGVIDGVGGVRVPGQLDQAEVDVGLCGAEARAAGGLTPRG